MIRKMSIQVFKKISSKMFVFFIFLVFNSLEVNAHGEFSILHHPKSIIFKGHDHLKANTVKEVYSSALGFSNTHFSNWKGIFISDPFNLAECVATVYVDGLPSLDQIKAHHFPLKSDTDSDNIFESVKDAIEARYPEENSQIIKVDLSNGLEDIVPHEIFKGIKNDKPKKLNHLYLKNNAEDREFLKEIHLLNKIAVDISEKVKSDGIPDLFWFKLPSLQALTNQYGVNSTQVKEAEQILNDAIIGLNNAFKKAYNGDVLFSVITSDGSHIRKTRSVEDGQDRNLNLASDYSEDYPVIFNIVLWLCVVLGFSLLAISLAIGGMDPGRDSIIYRMTNPRMKKDN